MKQITLGADPESFLERADGKIVSSIPVIGCNKKHPVDLGNGIRFYYDNVLAEMAFPPTPSIPDFIEVMREAFRSSQRFLGEKHRLLHHCAHLFGEDELGKKPEKMEGELPEEWEIGCNPSWDAYNRVQKIPLPFADGFRTGSFHLHIGHEMLAGGDENMEMKGMAVRLLDIFVGCSSVLFDKDPQAKARRKLYGRCGDFRSTPYGVEWRVLGNYALNSPKLVELVWELAIHAISLMEDGTGEAAIQSVSPEAVQFAVNEHNEDMARAVLERVALPWNLERKVVTLSIVDNWKFNWGI